MGIVAALAPLQAARGLGHEVIVADGGSADGTPERAAPLADRVIAAPRGRARQMNEAAAGASGYGLLFLHAARACRTTPWPPSRRPKLVC